MKKYLFIALAAAGMLSSCSSDDIVGGETTFDENELIPIRIGFGQTVTGTRGTGTVGGFDDASDNVWNKQVVNVYMLHKDSIGLAVFDPTTDPTPIYNNSPFYSPDILQTGIATPLDNSIKYYPTQKKYDFWGYRLDDAQPETPVIGTDSLTIGFTMDGSQDIMVAKAIPSAADSAKLIAHGNAAADRAFSSFAARYEIQPNLKFRHLLSRLTFKVIPGGPGAVNATTPVIVDSIKVISKNKGKLVVATLGDVKGEKQGIVWSGEQDSLVLMQRPALTGGATKNDSLNLVKLESVSLANQGDYETPGDPSTPFVGNTVPVGEALMVAAGETSYELYVYLHQPSLTQLNNASKTNIVYTYKDVIKIDGTQIFKPGYSYDVKITLWGLTDIKITTTLGKWEQGETIPMYPEDNE